MAAFVPPFRRHALLATVLLVPCVSFLIPSNNSPPTTQTGLPRPLGATAAALPDEINYAQAAQIRTQNGHDAAMHRYRQLLLENPRDTSAATFIAASQDSSRLLGRIGWQCTQLNDSSMDNQTQIDEDYEEDIAMLHKLLDLSHYRHSSIRGHIFNLPTGIDDDAGGNVDRSLGKYKNDYPMGPTYIRPLVAGQGIDLAAMLESGSSISTSPEWLLSLKCLVTLFLLSSCIPRSMFIRSIIGGEETLKLLTKLNIVFISDVKKGLKGLEEEDWVVPLIHLFPLEVPPMRLSPSDCKPFAHHKDGKNLVLMTDLHPSVLGMTSIKVENHWSPTGDEDEEGAVMYIGPDSLALVHHLHASMPQYAERRHTMQSASRILDVCTGSGVQALATLAMLELLDFDFPDLAVAVDINDRALRFTNFNARLNGFADKVRTISADLLSGKASRVDDRSLVEVLLNKLIQDETQKAFQHRGKGEAKFDIFLANPPFIPVPPERSDHAASSIRDESRNCGMNTPRYGLFSSGGSSGEDCLRAIIQMGPSLLRSNGGLMVAVSEFMNPPLPLTSKKTMNEDDTLTVKIEKWWSSQLAASSDAKGILFTNEFAISSDIYAQRRAVTNDQEDINVWKEHLRQSGIQFVSPGLLFVQTRNHESKQRGNGLELKHLLVPKTNQGSIWTPHNYLAVEFTQDMMLDLFR